MGNCMSWSTLCNYWDCSQVRRTLSGHGWATGRASDVTIHGMHDYCVMLPTMEKIYRICPFRADQS